MDYTSPNNIYDSPYSPQPYSPQPYPFFGSPNDADHSAEPTPHPPDSGSSTHGGGYMSTHHQYHGALDSIIDPDGSWADMTPMADGLEDLEPFDIVTWTDANGVQGGEDASSQMVALLDNDDGGGYASPAGTVASRAVTAATSSNTPLSDYYSCTNLSDTNPARRLHAAGVRTQINPPAYRAKERKFQNKEKLQLQALAAAANATAPTTAATQGSAPDIRYYPVLNGSPWAPSKPVGAARAVFTEATRADPEVMYHDKTAPRLGPNQRFDSFTLAHLREGKRTRMKREGK